MASTERDGETVTLQEWEGHVVEIGTDEFVARLIDLTAGHTYESEEATIPLAQISERDASSMRLGSFFRWTISRERSSGEEREPVSRIVFLDFPMTEEDIAAGKAWADRVMAIFEAASDEQGTAADEAAAVGSSRALQSAADATGRQS